jgi:predicted esterase
MHLIGLNGADYPFFNRFIPGRIDKLFGKGDFPYRRCWNTWNVRKIEQQIEEIKGIANKPYFVVGFSSGGNFAQILSSRDVDCEGLIIHSAQFMRQKPRRIPTLIIYTEGDKFGVNKELDLMIQHYKDNIGDLLTVFEQKSTTRFSHEFNKDSVLFIKSWFESSFGLSWSDVW